MSSISSAFRQCLAKYESLIDWKCELAPCHPDAIAELQRRVPVTSSIVEYLQITENEAGLFSPFELLRASEISTEYERVMRPFDGSFFEGYPEWHFEEPKPLLFDKHWREGWIPIAQQNYEQHIFVDTEPGPGGTIGQLALRDDALELTLLAGSLLEFFTQLPDKLLAPGAGDNPFDDQTYMDLW